MRQYLDLVEDVINNGYWAKQRNGERLTIWARQLRFDLTKGFPAVTVKKLNYDAVVKELIWFLDGGTNIRSLQAQGVHIWDANADPETGDVGPIYGFQWRNWNNSGHDQIRAAIDLLRFNPHTTRNMVSAWNVTDMAAMKLPPCHFAFQLHSDGQRLALQVAQRSADLMLGVPFNIASYATLAHLFGKLAGQTPVELIIDFGNVHIYKEHLPADRLLKREPLPLPTLEIVGDIPDDLKGLQPFQFHLHDYLHHPGIYYKLVA